MSTMERKMETTFDPDEALRAMAADVPAMPADFHASWTRAIREEAKSTESQENKKEGKIVKLFSGKPGAQARRLAAVAAVAVFLLGGTMLTRGRWTTPIRVEKKTETVAQTEQTVNQEALKAGESLTGQMAMPTAAVTMAPSTMVTATKTEGAAEADMAMPMMAVTKKESAAEEDMAMPMMAATKTESAAETNEAVPMMAAGAYEVAAYEEAEEAEEAEERVPMMADAAANEAPMMPSAAVNEALVMSDMAANEAPMMSDATADESSMMYAAESVNASGAARKSAASKAAGMAGETATPQRESEAETEAIQTKAAYKAAETKATQKEATYEKTATVATEKEATYKATEVEDMQTKETYGAEKTKTAQTKVTDEAAKTETDTVQDNGQTEPSAVPDEPSDGQASSSGGQTDVSDGKTALSSFLADLWQFTLHVGPWAACAIALIAVGLKLAKHGRKS